jgi:hypothetical protein
MLEHAARRVSPVLSPMVVPRPCTDDFLPRNQWVIDSAICQRPHDFAYDEHTGSICCPAPDYCCPNSVADCSTPGATLFDASRISDHRLVNGWRRHFYSRPATRGPSTVCNASGWNGGGTSSRSNAHARSRGTRRKNRPKRARAASVDARKLMRSIWRAPCVARSGAPGVFLGPRRRHCSTCTECVGCGAAFQATRRRRRHAHME